MRWISLSLLQRASSSRLKTRIHWFYPLSSCVLISHVETDLCVSTSAQSQKRIFWRWFCLVWDCEYNIVEAWQYFSATLDRISSSGEEVNPRQSDCGLLHFKQERRPWGVKLTPADRHWSLLVNISFSCSPVKIFFLSYLHGPANILHGNWAREEKAMFYVKEAPDHHRACYRYILSRTLEIYTLSASTLSPLSSRPSDSVRPCPFSPSNCRLNFHSLRTTVFGVTKESANYCRFAVSKEAQTITFLLTCPSLFVIFSWNLARRVWVLLVNFEKVGREKGVGMDTGK